MEAKPLPSGRKGKKPAETPPPPTEACVPCYLPEQSLTIIQRSKQSVSIPYFDESKDLGAQQYLFQPDALSVGVSLLIGCLADPPHRRKWTSR